MKLFMIFTLVTFLSASSFAGDPNVKIQIQYDTNTQGYTILDCGQPVSEITSQRCAPILSGAHISGTDNLHESIKSELVKYTKAPKTKHKKAALIALTGAVTVVAGVCVFTLGGCLWVPAIGILAGEGYASGFSVLAIDALTFVAAKKQATLSDSVYSVEDGLTDVLRVMGSMEINHATSATLEVAPSVIKTLKAMQQQNMAKQNVFGGIQLLN